MCIYIYIYIYIYACIYNIVYKHTNIYKIYVVYCLAKFYLLLHAILEAIKIVLKLFLWMLSNYLK